MTVNQGLATLAFFGVAVNLVMFVTRVLHQDSPKAMNNVSIWIGTTYMFSLVGAFVSDSYWGRYKTCAVFQIAFLVVSTTSLINYHTYIIQLSIQPFQARKFWFNDMVYKAI